MTKKPDGLTHLLDQILPQLAALLQPHLALIETRRYATAKNNPLESRRGFLDAAARGDFPSFKRSRSVVALWQDVETFIESRPRTSSVRAEETLSEDDEDRAMLVAGGIRLGEPTAAPALMKGSPNTTKGG